MFLEPHWQRITAVSALLYPLSLVFRAIVAARRAAYDIGLLETERLEVPVLVVGNITVGGTGKTPLVAWLAQFLARQGMHPGIVSRGYGSRRCAPRAVQNEANPRDVGDEPLLLAKRSGCPVWVGVDRAATARALLAAYPCCNAIISDDGLQHYRLRRNVELVVIDGARGLGNGWMLPAGPLREPASRLRSVDAVVVNNPPRAVDRTSRAVAMHLEGRRFQNLKNPALTVGPEYFRDRRVHAIAGIGHPPRFFSHLRDLGIEFEAHPFGDHHAFVPEDVAFADADAIVMTEKDAVKCAAFASESHWALPVDAIPDEALGELVLRKLRSKTST